MKVVATVEDAVVSNNRNDDHVVPKGMIMMTKMTLMDHMVKKIKMMRNTTMKKHLHPDELEAVGIAELLLQVTSENRDKVEPVAAVDKGKRPGPKLKRGRF